MKSSKFIIILFLIIALPGCTKPEKTAAELNQQAVILLTDLEKLDEVKAIEYLDKAVRLDPYFVEAYLNRAEAYLILEQYEQAFDDFSLAVELAPDSAEIYFRRAKAYRYLGKNKQAFEDFQQALRLNPTFADVYFERGKAYMSLNVYTHAYEDFNKAVSLDPNHKAKMFLNELSRTMSASPA